MSNKMLWKSLLFSPAILGATLVFGSSAIATEKQLTTEAAQPLAVVAPSAETDQPVVTAKTDAEALQNFSPAASTTEDVKAAFTKTSVLAGGNVQQKTLTDKVQAPTSSFPNLAETTLAQAVPSNTDRTLDQIMRYGNEGGSKKNTLGDVTSVSQLRDVQPTDWAFQALQSLVERYGCIEGYPDRTYRGNRALTRYEFAAGLNSCLDKIQELIAASNTGGISKEDLATLQRLQEEFAAELATLRGRVDALEARTARLEAQQFSTTTKLRGEAIFAIADVFGGKKLFNAVGTQLTGNVDSSNNTVFQDRVRLEFQSSFTGKDILHTRIAAGNALAFNNFPGTNSAGTTAEGTLQYFVGGTVTNKVVLDWLAYEFPMFGNSRVYVAATGGLHADYADTSNPYFYDGDGGNGAISAFAQQSPIYRIGGGSGAGISFAFGRGGSFFKPSSLTIGYLAGGSGNGGNAPTSANSPNDKNGLFDGNYSALGQLNFSVSDRLSFALTYVHGYHTSGSDIFDAGAGAGGRLVGTSVANLPSTLAASLPGGRSTPVVTNTYGAEAALRLSKYFSISGWASYTDATLLRRGSGEIWSYGLGVAVPNLGRQGNVLGLFAGAEPYLTNLDVAQTPSFRKDIPWHLEGFYKMQLTDNISITPGVIWLMAPEQNKNNDDIFIGTLRTTFTF